MRIRLLSFGPWRRLLPEGGEWRELPHGVAVADLLANLRAEGQFEAVALRGAAVAVNGEYAQRTQVLADGDEVAILPPVSGGASPQRTGSLGTPASPSGTPAEVQIALVREPIDATVILREIKAGGDGAVCVFDGIVRDNTRGRQTLHLDYESFEVMALKLMHGLRAEAIATFGVRDVAIVHRLGRLGVGETSVLIVVASAHRGAAFEACRWVIDTLKTTVPIWKLEQFVDGAVWSDGEPFPESVVRPAG